MKPRAIAVILLFGAIFSVTARAEDDDAPWLHMQTQINFDTRSSTVDKYENNLRVAETEIGFEVLLHEGIKLYLLNDLTMLLNKRSPEEKLKFSQMLEEAFIVIETDKVSGLPRAIISFGKQLMAFGQGYNEIPLHEDTLLYELSRQAEVIGLTVELPNHFFKLVDSAAISVFESGEADFKISHEKGMSIQLKKNFSERMATEISALIKQNPGSDRLEKRGSVGFVFQNKEGSKKIWAEGIVTEYRPESENHTLGLQVGASQKWGPGTIVVETEYIMNQATDLTMAYNLPIGSLFILSPEIRWRKGSSENFHDDTMIAIRAHLETQANAKHNLLKGRLRRG